MDTTHRSLAWRVVAGTLLPGGVGRGRSRRRVRSSATVRPHHGRHDHASITAAAGVPAAAATHAVFPAEAPPVATGDVVRTTITAEEATISIAPGVSYRAWTFNGSVPGPVLHAARANGSSSRSEPHLDAALARPSRGSHPGRRRFADVPPGGSKTISFVATDAGAFLYHCVTMPALMHIADGMYGALIVDPVRPLPRVAHEFVLVASEVVPNGPGKTTPAAIDWDKASSCSPTSSPSTATRTSTPTPRCV